MHYLLQVMTSVGSMEQAPFLGIQRTEKGMIQKLGTLSETTFSIEQSSIHGY